MLDDNSTSLAIPDVPGKLAARWLQIAGQLRVDIAEGRFAPGTRLPNESVLADRFEVHRHTLRQAVRQLVHEGHLRVEQGRGTFVRELVLDYALKRRTRMSENLAEAGERAQRELLHHETTAAGEWAELLRLSPRAEVELLHTRATVRGRPIGLSTTAYPAARLRGMGEAFRSSGSVTGALQRLGVSDYQRASSTVSCRLPTPSEADALARAATEPVLVVQFHSIDSDGVPVEAGRTLFAADAVQLTVAHES
jgi:GntR family phosphonate transport system transcriptional regulator